MLLLVLLALLILYACVCVYFYRFAFVRKDKPDSGAMPNIPDMSDPVWGQYSQRMQEGAQWIEAQKPERVHIHSFDKLKLSALYLPAENQKAVALLMHGYRSTGVTDFSCVAKFYHELGIGMLIPDERACGASEGRHITFGVHERYDCQRWASYLDARLGGDTPIILHGLSMGATTVLMTAALQLPDSVKCVVADCGFTSPLAIIRHVMRVSFHLRDFPVMYGVRFLARKWAGFDLDEASTLDALRVSTLPTLFLHGGRDHFVPTYMGLANYNACRAEKRLAVVAEAGHAQSYLVDPEKCQQALVEFLEGGLLSC